MKKKELTIKQKREAMRIYGRKPTQATIAQIMGVTENTLGNWERTNRIPNVRDREEFESLYKRFKVRGSK